MSIDRNPESYNLTDYAYNKVKQRDIPPDVVATIIREGNVFDNPKPGCYSIQGQPWYCDNPIRLVVDPKDKEILTVMWRYE